MGAFAALCLTATRLNFHVQLTLEPGGPALITGKPSRLTSIRVADRDDTEIAFAYIHPRHSIDDTAGLLIEEMRMSK